jgi:hypothetical protein
LTKIAALNGGLSASPNCEFVGEDVLGFESIRTSDTPFMQVIPEEGGPVKRVDVPFFCRFPAEFQARRKQGRGQGGDILCQPSGVMLWESLDRLAV